MSRILALSGSPRPGSFTRMALQVSIDAAKKAGASVEIYDLSERTLPLFAGRTGQSQAPEVLEFLRLVTEADGLLIATPVYHESISGALKNALDFLYRELADKVAGLIAVSGGRTGAALALEHLRVVLRETQTWVLPRHVPILNSEEAFDEAGAPKDKDTAQRLQFLGLELMQKLRVLRPRPKPG